MTDNGSPYVSTIHTATVASWGSVTCGPGLTAPRPTARPSVSIQTMLREWAYERLCGSSAERRLQLPGWLDRYNYRRKHGSLGLGTLGRRSTLRRGRGCPAL